MQEVSGSIPLGSTTHPPHRRPFLRLTRAVRMAALAALLPAPALAEDFRVILGGNEIGALSLDGAGENLALAARFANTPLGVADGTYEASSRPAVAASGATVRQFLSRSAFTSGSRTVSVLLDGPRVAETVIDPAGDRTGLSEPAAVPEGVLDPVQAFAALARAGGCPAPLRLYDGRRVAEVSVAPTGGQGGDATCRGTYRVVAGPGHLSPLGIAAFDLDLAYRGGALAAVTVRTGPFELRLQP